jgi:cytochrome P450
MMETRPAPDDVLGPAWVGDPFPRYARLRETTPALAGQRWLVMRHEDVLRAVSDPVTFSSDHGHSPNPALRDTPIIFEDPPAHTSHRKLVNKAFTPRRVAELEPWTAQMAGLLLDRLGAGAVDVMDGFCDELPVRVIARLMGVEEAETARFKRWSDQRSYLIGTSGAGSHVAPEALEEARAANDLLIGYFREAATSRRVDPQPDLITGLVQAEVDGESLTDEQISGICALLLTAGNVTTTNLLGNLLHLLAHRPDWYERLRSDRALVAPVIEEVLRYASPVQWMGRTTTRDTELGGVSIPAGAQVLLFYGSANRDPAAFPDPDELRLGTNEKGHMAFGHGIHFCLGAPLARMEARVGLDAFLDRYAAVAPGAVEPTRITAAPTHCGFEALPLVLTPA